MLPLEDLHVQRARANEEFAKPLSTIDMPAAAWKVTVAFYAALHYVEAAIARNGGRPSSSHTDRDSEIRKYAETRRIQREYRDLKNAARLARYDPETDFGGAKNSYQTQALCDHVLQIKKGLGY